MKNKYKILIVDDDEKIRSYLHTLLDANGYRVIVASDCLEAKTLYFSHVPDLIILDLGLPDNDGSVVLESVRKSALTPVIILSARNEESEKVRLLDMGANDYVTKPFGSAELLARLRTALRNTRYSSNEGRLPGGKFSLGELIIDYDARRISVGQTEIKFTQTEYNIIAFLSGHVGKVMTYSSIIKSIWKEYPSDSSIKKLQVNIANIRNKFGVKSGKTNYIVNVLGVGYLMNG